jgi:hypothetical protein
MRELHCEAAASSSKLLSRSMPCSWHRATLRNPRRTIFMGYRRARQRPIIISHRPRWPIGPLPDRMRFEEMMEMIVLDRMELMGAGAAATALLTLASLAFWAGPASAEVIYCKTVGVPKGCVVRPGEPVAAAVVVAPGVGVGAPGVGVRPGTPMNRGGPVDRVGRR